MISADISIFGNQHPIISVYNDKKLIAIINTVEYNIYKIENQYTIDYYDSTYTRSSLYVDTYKIRKDTVIIETSE